MNPEPVQSEINSTTSHNHSSTRFCVQPTDIVTLIAPTSTTFTSGTSSTISINNLANKNPDECEDKFLSSLSDTCDNFQDHCEDSNSKKICLNKTDFIAGTTILSIFLIANTVLCLLFANQYKKANNLNNQQVSHEYSLYSDCFNEDNFKRYIRYLKRNQETLVQNYQANKDNEYYKFNIEKTEQIEQTEQTSNTDKLQDSDNYAQIDEIKGKKMSDKQTSNSQEPQIQIKVIGTAHKKDGKTGVDNEAFPLENVPLND